MSTPYIWPDMTLADRAELCNFRAYLLRREHARGYLTAAELEEALNRPVPSDAVLPAGPPSAGGEGGPVHASLGAGSGPVPISLRAIRLIVVSGAVLFAALVLVGWVR